MSFADLLINTATIRRYTPGAIDPYGNPAETWADHIVGEPCRLMATKGIEVKVGAAVVIADYQLFIDHVDVTEQDRVVVDGVTYEILLVGHRQDSDNVHHLELLMDTVR